MVNFQRKKIQVANELRKKPRIEFHAPVGVIGINAKAEIIDFSTTGFFIRMDSTEELKEGQIVRLALRFPSEAKSTITKAKIVRVEKNGFGCQFFEPDPQMREMLERNFTLFSITFPLE